MNEQHEQLTDHSIAEMADYICSRPATIEWKTTRLQALHSEYGIITEELISIAVKKSDEFRKCPICENDPTCVFCHGKGKILTEQYDKMMTFLNRDRASEEE